jgi:hypothetical protein
MKPRVLTILGSLTMLFSGVVAVNIVAHATAVSSHAEWAMAWNISKPLLRSPYTFFFTLSFGFLGVLSGSALTWREIVARRERNLRLLVRRPLFAEALDREVTRHALADAVGRPGLASGWFGAVSILSFSAAAAFVALSYPVVGLLCPVGLVAMYLYELSRMSLVHEIQMDSTGLKVTLADGRVDHVTWEQVAELRDAPRSSGPGVVELMDGRSISLTKYGRAAQGAWREIEHELKLRHFS